MKEPNRLIALVLFGVTVLVFLDWQPVIALSFLAGVFTVIALPLIAIFKVVDQLEGKIDAKRARYGPVTSKRAKNLY